MFRDIGSFLNEVWKLVLVSQGPVAAGIPSCSHAARDRSPPFRATLRLRFTKKQRNRLWGSQFLPRERLQTMSPVWSEAECGITMQPYSHIPLRPPLNLIIYLSNSFCDFYCKYIHIKIN